MAAPRRVTIVEATGMPHGAADAARALEASGIECSIVSTGGRRTVEATRPDLVLNLVGRLGAAADLAARLEERALPFTGPTARGLARAAGDAGWRSLVQGVDVISGAVVVEGMDVPVAVIGNDPVLVVPGVAAGDELSTFELAGAAPGGGATSDGGATPTPETELAALVQGLRASLELRDFAYLVVRLSPSGHLWLAAVDPLPSLGRSAHLAVTVEREHWEYEVLVQRIVQAAWQRVETRAARPEAPPAAPP